MSSNSSGNGHQALTGNLSSSALRMLVADLASEDSGIRLSAIVQLGQVEANAEILEIVRKSLENETNADCRAQLEELFRSLSLRLRARYNRNQAPLVIRPAMEFANGILTHNDAVIEEFLSWIPRLSRELITRIIEKVARAPGDAGSLRVILGLDETFFRGEVLETLLLKCLIHQDGWIVLRSLQLLQNLAPERLITRLPVLLQHPFPPIRTQALRLLYRIAPEEAIRLIGELVQSEDVAQKHMAFSLLFSFPFEAISPLIVELLEKELIPPTAVPLVENLVQSNPDRLFLTRLMSLGIQGKGPKDLLRILIKSAVQALHLSRMENGQPQEIARKFWLAEKKRLSGLLKEEVLVPQEPPGEEKDSLNQAAPNGSDKDVSDKTTEGPMVLKLGNESKNHGPALGEQYPQGSMDGQNPLRGPAKMPDPKSSTDGTFFEGTPDRGIPRVSQAPGKESFGEFRQKKQLSSQDVTFVMKVLASLGKVPEILAAIDFIGSREAGEGHFQVWLEERVGKGEKETRLAAMEVLGLQAPRVLLRHLPHMVFDESPEISTQAIRHLRRIEGKVFVKRLQNWMTDGSKSGKRVALTGLVQLEFPLARQLVLRYLENAQDRELIDCFGQILLMNPEYATLLSLRTLAGKSFAGKKDLLNNLIKTLEETLEQMSVYQPTRDPGQTPLLTMLHSEKWRATWNDLLAQIQKIHYHAAAGLGGIEGDASLGLMVFGLVAGLFLVNQLWFWVFPRPDALETKGIAGSEKMISRLALPQKAFELPFDHRVVGTLGDYDPLNHLWKLKLDDGPLVKLDFGEVIQAYRLGDHLEVTAKRLRHSPLGFGILDVLRSRKL